MDLKLELVLIPVFVVDRAKSFYVEKLGFNLDVDHSASEDFRVVQMTPPGWAWSITIGKVLPTPHPALSGGPISSSPRRQAGIDVELPDRDCYGQPLLNAVRAGKVELDVINEAVRRVLQTKFEFVEPGPIDVFVGWSSADVMEAGTFTVAPDPSGRPVDKLFEGTVQIAGPERKEP